MMGHENPKLHPKYEVSSFSCSRKIQQNPKHFRAPYRSLTHTFTFPAGVILRQAIGRGKTKLHVKFEASPVGLLQKIITENP